MKIIYLAGFLDENSKEKILSQIVPKHEKIFCDHVTINYRPTFEEISKFNFGEEKEILVTGFVENKSGQVCVVSGIESENETPHITISTKETQKPNYLNELLKTSEIIKLEKPIQIKVILGGFDGEKAVFKIESEEIENIFIPSRLQVDTLIAIFLLKKFGNLTYKNIETAKISTLTNFVQKEKSLSIMILIERN